MTNLFEILSSSWSQALGWTLLHSLWQSVIIFLLVLTLHRFVHTRYANVRYLIAVGGLATLCLASVATFLHIHLQISESITVFQQVHQARFTAESGMTAALPGERSFLNIVQAYMPFIVAAWLIGALAFMARMLGGWWYVLKLKQEAIPASDQWLDKLNSIRYALGIRQWVELAVSVKISTPVVLGYAKPVILVPVGIFTGLTPQQVETVFLHELMHIKRNDYLINLIQSFIESIFFFNPFVWILSSVIRREREHCCDDAVVANHAEALDYAHALAKLEEARLHSPTLALPLSANKNHLLYRIKRILERSANRYPLRERMIPLLLLITGLTCASWLSVQSDSPNETTNREAESTSANRLTIVYSDTTIKEKSASYSQKVIITTSEDGQPKKEVIEEFEGDEDLRKQIDDLVQYEFHFNFEHPSPMPDFNFPMDSDYTYQYSLHIDSIPFNIDTIPQFDYQWQKEFGDAFEKTFRENHQHLEKMMNDIHLRFEDGQWQKQFEKHIEKMHEQLEESRQRLLELDHEKLARLHEEHSLAVQNKIEETRQRMMEWEKEHGETHRRNMDNKLKALEKNMQAFEKALKDELVKDGYLKKNEELKSLNWNNDHIEVNGKSIKRSDEKKYRELHNRYMK